MTKTTSIKSKDINNFEWPFVFNIFVDAALLGITDDEKQYRWASWKRNSVHFCTCIEYTLYTAKKEEYNKYTIIKHRNGQQTYTPFDPSDVNSKNKISYIPLIDLLNSTIVSQTGTAVTSKTIEEFICIQVR